MESGRLLTLDEIADRMQVSVPTVRRYIKAGKLPATKPSGVYRVQARDFEDFIERYAAGNLAEAPSSRAEGRRVAAEIEVRTGLALADSQWGREVSERDDLSIELAEVAMERLEDRYEDAFGYYHSLLDSGVSEGGVGGLATALLELIVSVDTLTDAAARLERDPARRGRLVDIAARRRRQRPEIPHSAAG